MYILKEQLSPVFTKMEDLILLDKAEKKPYSDRQLVKIAFNIIRNANDFKKGQS